MLRSWALIMANTTYIQFVLTDVNTTVLGDVAVLTCVENILTAGEEGEASFAAGKVVASNVYLRTAQGWRLWMHHGSPVLQGDDDEEEEGELSLDRIALKACGPGAGTRARCRAGARAGVRGGRDAVPRHGAGRGRRRPDQDRPLRELAQALVEVVEGEPVELIETLAQRWPTSAWPASWCTGSR
ncbi:Alternative dihydrofolate reductase 3 [[Actinomadura] parvosata subsp. kistnae]|nr:Alternative dihydrofolate reductase 3 [Actinomadura parvosata subsp. kistnae]